MDYGLIDEEEKKELRKIANEMRLEFGFEFDVKIAGKAIIDSALEHKAKCKNLANLKIELMEAGKPIPEELEIEYEDRRHKIERLRCLFDILYDDEIKKALERN